MNHDFFNLIDHMLLSSIGALSNIRTCSQLRK